MVTKRDEVAYNPGDLSLRSSLVEFQAMLASVAFQDLKRWMGDQVEIGIQDLRRCELEQVTQNRGKLDGLNIFFMAVEIIEQSLEEKDGSKVDEEEEGD